MVKYEPRAGCTRGKVLERETREVEDAADMEDNPQFWREKLAGKAGLSRWVDEEKLGKISQR